MRSLGGAASPLLPKVLLHWQTGAFGSEGLGRLQPLQFTLEDRERWLRNGSIRQDSWLAVELEARARVVQQVTNTVLEVDGRRPATLARGADGLSRHGAVNTHRRCIRVINLVAVHRLGRGRRLAGSVLIALRGHKAGQLRVAARRQPGQTGLTWGRPASRRD